MTNDQALLSIATSLDNIHQVLIHLTSVIQSGAPAATSSNVDVQFPTPTQVAAIPDPTPDPDPIQAPAFGQPNPNLDNDHLTGDWVDFNIDTITHSIDDNGRPAYKGRGHPYSQYGVRIWPEIFVRLGIPIESIVIGENPIDPLYVRAVLNEMGNPRKIVGFAPGTPPPVTSNGNNAPPHPEPYPQRDIRSQPDADEIPF